jgi:hypothetical protein
VPENAAEGMLGRVAMKTFLEKMLSAYQHERMRGGLTLFLMFM